MRSTELAVAVDRCAALSMKLHMIGDRRIEKELGLAVARRSGLYDRGFRLFYAMTEPESASARNLRDEGFRTRFEAIRYVRETD